MLTQFCIVSFFLLCKGLKEVPDNILYHELVHYDTNSVKNSHNRHRRSLDPHLSLFFYAFNRTFNLKLSKNEDVFTEDIKFTSDKEDNVPYDLYSLVKGTVNDDPSSFVHGSVHDGVFTGVIDLEDDTYHLEEASRYYHSPSKHSLIYRLRDVLIDETNNKCGVKNHTHPESFVHDHGWYEDGKLKYIHRHKRDTTPTTTVRYCDLYMAADYRFYDQHSDNFVQAIYSKLGTYVQQINKIYYSTTFPGYSHRVKFLIKHAHVYTDKNNVYDSGDYAVAKFLDIFSSLDDGQLKPDDYCLAYMFTHRDFEDGVLGLAWVASSGRDSGGLCTKCKTYDSVSKSRCLNTGIVTTKNVKEVPALQSYLTFGHELGHNLGSPHDPESCSPGSSNGGNYLMYPHANTGHDDNNKKLSTCSRDIMGPILSIRATCFKDNPKVCGDFVVDADVDEQCDCGDSVSCEKDRCCNTDCKFRDSSFKCSNMDGVCCDVGICKPYNSSITANQVLCSTETDCRRAVHCQVDNYTCPIDDDQYFKNDTTLCNEGTQVCLRGTCTESLCVFSNTTSCQCTEEENKCMLCCEKEIDGKKQCLLATEDNFPGDIQTKLNETTKRLQPGSVCGDNMGYCDIFYTCRIVDADGPIASLGNYIFNGVLFDSARNMAIQYWYYCIMMAIGLLCFMAAFIAVCSKTVKPPRTPRGGERMSYPVTYKNVHNTGIELRATRHI